MLSTKILLFFSACVACSVFTALLRRWAPRLGLVDEPDNHRKTHGRSTPLGGGLAISAAMALCMGILAYFPNSLRPFFDGHVLQYLGYVLSASVLVAVGVIDDRNGLRGRVKLVGQVVSALILIAGGLLIRNVSLFGWNIELGLLSVPFTLFWLLGAINALNLLDGMDGMAGTIGLILVSAIAFLAHLTGSQDVEVVAVAFAGCLLGFLGHNLPPARIFLGDAGSMLIGLVVGSLSIEASLKGAGTVLLAAPLAICTIPVLDSFAAIVRRKLTGRSIFSTDRGHLHHHLLNRLGCNRRALRYVVMLCSVTACAALASVFMHNDLIALITCLGVLGVMIATNTFGRAETALLVKHAGRFGRSLVRPGETADRMKASDTFHLQGNRPWGMLLESFVEAGEKYELVRLRVDINVPSIHEIFSAVWRSEGSPEAEEVWILQMPLKVNGQIAGRLDISGRRDGEFPCDEVEGLLELAEEFEMMVANLVAEVTETGHDEAMVLAAAGTTEADGVYSEGPQL